MAHTPGPWEIAPGKKQRFAKTYVIRQEARRYGEDSVLPEARLRICELYGHRFGSADNTPGDGMRDLADADREGCQQDNARLIAQAPSMADDLARFRERIMEWAYAMGEHGNPALRGVEGEMWSMASDMRDRLMAAGVLR